MSKKATSVDPLSLLREYITGNKPVKQSEDSLNFGSAKLPLNTPTAWNPKVTGKQYSLGDLWLFLDSHLNPSKYPENKYYDEQKKYNLQIVSAYDKDEIINYFTGKIEDSEAINQELKASIKVNKDKKKPNKPKYEGEPAPKKKIKSDEDGKGMEVEKEVKEGEQEQIEETKMDNSFKDKENLRLMDLIFRLEKPIDSKNRALRKANKSFKSVLSYFSTEPKPSQDANAAVETPKKESTTRLEEVLHMGGGLGQSNPIILVLSVPTPGALSLENAREFFEQGVYKDPSQVKKDMSDKIKQTVQKEIAGRRITFDVMSDPGQIKKDGLWPRVVAIFVTGYVHQFQGWPDSDKVSILFSKRRAYHMKYHDVPLHDNIRKWNVKLLEVNRTKRYLDAIVKNTFWEDLELFLLQPPK